jgi:protein-tyrosine phosphatase
MGNICRSPLAEAVFRAAVVKAGLEPRIHIDSAGTGDWHVGQPPDRRAIAIAKERGYDLANLRARQVRRGDFARFDWVLAMDRTNLTALQALRPTTYVGHLGLFLAFAPHLGIAEVPDPYYGSAREFTRVLDLVEHGSNALLEHVVARLDVARRG